MVIWNNKLVKYKNKNFAERDKNVIEIYLELFLKILSTEILNFVMSAYSKRFLESEDFTKCLRSIIWNLMGYWSFKADQLINYSKISSLKPPKFKFEKIKLRNEGNFQILNCETFISCKILI